MLVQRCDFYLLKQSCAPVASALITSVASLTFSAKMIELFHPVLLTGVFSPIPTGLSCTASPADHVPLPGYLLLSL